MSACCHSDRDCDRKQSGTRCRRRESRGQGRVPRRSPSRPAPRCRSRSVGGAMSHAPGDFPEWPGASGSAGAPGMTWPTAWPLAPSRSQQRISARGAQAVDLRRLARRAETPTEKTGASPTPRRVRMRPAAAPEPAGNNPAGGVSPAPRCRPRSVLQYACFDMRTSICVLQHACSDMRAVACELWYACCDMRAVICVLRCGNPWISTPL